MTTAYVRLITVMIFQGFVLFCFVFFLNLYSDVTVFVLGSFIQYLVDLFIYL